MKRKAKAPKQLTEKSLEQAIKEMAVVAKDREEVLNDAVIVEIGDKTITFVDAQKNEIIQRHALDHRWTELVGCFLATNRQYKKYTITLSEHARHSINLITNKESIFIQTRNLNSQLKQGI